MIRRRFSPFRSCRAGSLCTRQLAGALIVGVLTSVFVSAFYINYPEPRVNADTPSYLAVAENIRENGTFTDPFRLPGYPLFISLMFLVFGNDNLQALSIAQGVLFVITAIEIYVITYLITRRVWIASTVALIASVNTDQLSYAQGVIVEGFALWTVVTLALAIVLFFTRPGARALWLVAGALLLALMTRPEWLYVAVPLFAFIVISARRLDVAWRLMALHACAAVAVIYGIVGVYMYANGSEKSYGPFVVMPRVNSLGKIMQYRMQHDAPAEYADVTRRIDAFLARKDVAAPYEFIAENPDLGANYWRLAGDYARTTIRNAPFEYIQKTLELTHSATLYRRSFGGIDRTGPFSRELSYIETQSARVHDKYRYFPAIAIVCLIAWLGIVVRGYRAPRAVFMVAALAFLGLYQLFVVSAGAYADWPRLFTPLNPVRVIVIFASTLVALALLARVAESRALELPPRHVRAVLWAWLGGMAALLLALIASPLTARLGSVGWSARAWLEVHPVGALTLLVLWGWLGLVVLRVIRKAAERPSSRAGRVQDRSLPGGPGIR